MRWTKNGLVIRKGSGEMCNSLLGGSLLCCDYMINICLVYVLKQATHFVTVPRSQILKHFILKQEYSRFPGNDIWIMLTACLVGRVWALRGVFSSQPFFVWQWSEHLASHKQSERCKHFVALVRWKIKEILGMETVMFSNNSLALPTTKEPSPSWIMLPLQECFVDISV